MNANARSVTARAVDATAVVLLLLLHSRSLLEWGRFAWGNDLFSYTLLIPAVSAYLIYTEREKRSGCTSAKRWPSAALALALMLISILVFTSSGNFVGDGDGLQSWVSLRMLSVVLSAWAILVWLGGFPFVRGHLFAIVFVIATIPFPPSGEHALETGLQYGSAEVASIFFSVTGMTFFRDQLTFALPGISLEVAPECSGIHSTVVLFVVSLVAGKLFLRSPYRRLILTAAVLPLGLLRNGFRVWTLGTLCVYDDPSWIKSPLHHRGGPIFFALSLIPFAWLLWALVRGEKKQSNTKPIQF